MHNDRKSNYKDPYQKSNGRFNEPSLSQMASMTTKGLLIAKVTGADVTWRQVFAPMIIVILISIGMLGLCGLMLVIAYALNHN